MSTRYEDLSILYIPNLCLFSLTSALFFLYIKENQYVSSFFGASPFLGIYYLYLIRLTEMKTPLLFTNYFEPICQLTDSQLLNTIKTSNSSFRQLLNSYVSFSFNRIVFPSSCFITVFTFFKFFPPPGKLFIQFWSRKLSQRSNINLLLQFLWRLHLSIDSTFPQLGGEVILKKKLPYS